MRKKMNKEKGKKRKLFFTGLFVNAAFAFMIVAIILLLLNNLLNEKRLDALVSGGYTVFMPENATNFSVTSDNKTYSYIENGKLLVKNTTDNKLITEISDKNPIIYSTTMEDRHIIIYFTYGNEGSKTTSKSTNYGSDGDLIKDLGKDTITINSYDVERNASTTQHKFSVKNLMKIEDIEFSPLTNMIYINAKVGTSDKGATNTIYRANITNRVHQITSEQVIKKISVLSATDTIYYQTDKNTIYKGESKVNPNKNEKQGYNLLGVDSSDNIYLQSVATPKLVYKMNESKVIGKIEIADTAFVGVKNAKSGLFLIYNDRVVNIAKEVKEEILFYDGTKYQDIFTEKLYMISEQKQISFRSLK